MLQFEYKNLPKELQNKALLHRARGEGLIISIGKNENGRRRWRVSDNIKCKNDNDKNDNDKNDNDKNDNDKNDNGKKKIEC